MKIKTLTVEQKSNDDNSTPVHRVYKVVTKIATEPGEAFEELNRDRVLIYEGTSQFEADKAADDARNEMYL